MFIVVYPQKRTGGPPPLEVGESMIAVGSHHQMIDQLPSQSIFSEIVQK